MQNNSPENRVLRYIRMKKFFMVSDALLVTSLPPNTLLKILEKLENNGLIIQDKDEKSLMNRSYVVLSRKEKRVPISNNTITKIDIELIKSLTKVLLVLKDIEFESLVVYYKLLNQTKLTKGVFAKVIKTLLTLDVLIEQKRDEFETKENRVFEINRNLLNDLLTFIKQKKYKELQEILEGKKPLRYVVVPKDLTSVLDVIIKNEALKRDELALNAGIARGTLTTWWKIIKKLGIIKDSYKENDNERVTYIFSSKRAKIVLGYIFAGAYEKDKELKHLWIEPMKS